MKNSERASTTEHLGTASDFPLSIPPNKEGFAYSSPTIKLPDGTYVMDSRAIANKLEELYPTPPLHLDSPVLAKLEAIMPELMPTLSGIYIPLVPKNILDPASHPHWYKTREAKFGMPLDELAETKGGDVAYNGAKPYLEQVTALLRQDTSGPYFLGTEVSYADFVWGGFLDFFGRVDPKALERILQTSGDGQVHVRLMDGLKEWRARDNY